jgi:hypothetical protein
VLFGLFRGEEVEEAGGDDAVLDVALEGGDSFQHAGQDEGGLAHEAGDVVAPGGPEVILAPEGVEDLVRGGVDLGSVVEQLVEGGGVGLGVEAVLEAVAGAAGLACGCDGAAGETPVAAGGSGFSR